MSDRRIAFVGAVALLLATSVPGAASSARVSGLESCAVTVSNQTAPPGEERVKAHGNGKIWVAIPPNGIFEFVRDSADVAPDGSMGTKVLAWREAGRLTIRGRRLDAYAPPMRGDIAPGYEGTFQPTGFSFPTEGCWQVTVKAIGTLGRNQVLSTLNVVVFVVAPPAERTLANGETSVPVMRIPAPERLVIDDVRIRPQIVRAGTRSITLRLKVRDTRGYVVRHALVLARSLPAVTTQPLEQATAIDGFVTLRLRPKRSFPLVFRRGAGLRLFIRTRRDREPIRGGISARRLVRVSLARPS